MDSRGYSSKIIKANLEADCQSPGVMLGRFCISTEVPVKDTAEYFGVSRMTVYKWFTGQWIPRQKQAEKIHQLLDKAGFKV